MKFSFSVRVIASRTCMRHWLPLWWRGCFLWLGRTRTRRPCAPACPSRLPPWTLGSWLPPAASLCNEGFNAETPRANNWGRTELRCALQFQADWWKAGILQSAEECESTRLRWELCVHSHWSAGKVGEAELHPLSRFPTGSTQHCVIDARLRDRYW